MVMPVELPAVTVPMVRSITVTVTPVLATITAVAVAMMMRVLVGVAAVPAVLQPLITEPGVPVLEKKSDGHVSVCRFNKLMATPGAGQLGEKKFDGKKRVIVPPDDREPAPLGRNENVAVLPAC